MFLFSKKFLSLLLMIALVFVGERRSAEGLVEKCWECDGGNHDCDAKHDGVTTDCFSPHSVCAMTNDGGKIKKFCEDDAAKWSDNGQNGGKPKCEKNKACYCDDADLCNRDISFGMEAGTTGGPGGGNGGGAGDKNGSVGTKGMLPAISILFWMMATVAMALVPSIFIPTK